MNSQKQILRMDLDVLVQTYREPVWVLNELGDVLAMNTLTHAYYKENESLDKLPIVAEQCETQSHLLSQDPYCQLVLLRSPNPMHNSNDSREDLLKAFIQFIPNPIFVKDRQHRWILLNRSFADFLGKEPEALIGKSDHDFFPKAEADVFWQKDEKVFLSGQLNENEESFTDVNGQTRWILTRKVTFLNEKQEPILLGVITDITEQQLLAQNINKERLQAEQANRVKSEFLARMSHELRTPLNAIIGFSQVIKKSTERLTEAETNYLERIRSNGLYLLHLINDLLDLSVVEAGQIELQTTDCNVADLITDLAAFFAPLAEEKGLVFTAKTLPLTLNTDATRLRQIVSNLLQNAIKFTSKGYVSLRLITKENKAIIIIEDSGPGIPEPMKEQIFQEFIQAKEVIVSSQEGVGLGLAISKSLSEALGFRLTLQPKASGACFVLDLNTAI